MPETQEQSRKTTPVRTPAAIVVGVDGSDSAITAIRWAAAQTRATGARLRLIHAVKESVRATIALPAPVSFIGAAPPPPGPAGASLLVVGSPGLSRLSGSLTGPVGVQVTAQAHCPTVVVRGQGDPNGPVMVAVDASRTSAPALRLAFAEAARRHPGLVAVHAWPPPVMPVGAGHAVVHTMAPHRYAPRWPEPPAR